MKDIPACLMFKIVAVNKRDADGIEYVWTDSDISPSELVDILCTKLQEDKTNQDEDENDDSIDIDNLLDECLMISDITPVS
ncbi:hypothetical protein DPMN_097010 [Dreissena polymorpha]|uniref:Uncharacterized protein n=1 Tax=Dreissena polymorpha TaxID=45954 RepID=A0A9D4L9S7_DREPO|nr:hypothetical protein DPMN_097010 [Dreissena polymorpha]